MAFFARSSSECELLGLVKSGPAFYARFHDFAGIQALLDELVVGDTDATGCLGQFGDGGRFLTKRALDESLGLGGAGSTASCRPGFPSSFLLRRFLGPFGRSGG